MSDYTPLSEAIARASGGSSSTYSSGYRSPFAEITSSLADKADEEGDYLSGQAEFLLQQINRAADTDDPDFFSGVVDGVRGLAEGGTNIVMGALDALDTVRSGTLSALVEIDDLLRDPEDASFGDWLQQTRDNIGVGDLLEDSTMPMWLKRGAGFVGDVATDPLTYVTLGTGSVVKSGAKGAARAVAEAVAKDTAERAGRRVGKELLTSKMVQRRVASLLTDEDSLARFGRDRLMQEIDRVGRARGGAALSNEIAQEIGVKTGARFGIGRFGVMLPGTQRMSASTAKFISRLKAGTLHKLPLPDKWQTLPGMDQLRKSDELGFAKSFLAEEAWDQARIAGSKVRMDWTEELDDIFTEFSIQRKILPGRQLEIDIDDLRRAIELGDFTDNPAALRFRKFFDQIRWDAMDETDEWIPRFENYLPHQIDRSFREFVRAGSNRSSQEAFTLKRQLTEGKMFLGHELRKGNIDEIEDIARRVLGDDYVKIFADNPFLIGQAYIDHVSRYVTKHVMLRNLERFGLAKQLDGTVLTDLRLWNENLTGVGKKAQELDERLNEVIGQQDDLEGVVARAQARGKDFGQQADEVERAGGRAFREEIEEAQEGVRAGVAAARTDEAIAGRARVSGDVNPPKPKDAVDPSKVKVQLRKTPAGYELATSWGTYTVRKVREGRWTVLSPEGRELGVYSSVRGARNSAADAARIDTSLNWQESFRRGWVNPQDVDTQTPWHLNDRIPGRPDVTWDQMPPPPERVGIVELSSRVLRGAADIDNPTAKLTHTKGKGWTGARVRIGGFEFEARKNASGGWDVFDNRIVETKAIGPDGRPVFSTEPAMADVLLTVKRREDIIPALQRAYKEIAAVRHERVMEQLGNEARRVSEELGRLRQMQVAARDAAREAADDSRRLIDEYGDEGWVDVVDTYISEEPVRRVQKSRKVAPDAPEQVEDFGEPVAGRLPDWVDSDVTQDGGSLGAAWADDPNDAIATTWGLDTVTDDMVQDLRNKLRAGTRKSLKNRDLPEEFWVFRAGPVGAGDEPVSVSLRADIGESFEGRVTAYRIQRKDVMVDTAAFTPMGYVNEQELLVNPKALRAAREGAEDAAPTPSKPATFKTGKRTVANKDVQLKKVGKGKTVGGTFSVTGDEYVNGRLEFLSDLAGEADASGQKLTLKVNNPDTMAPNDTIEAQAEALDAMLREANESSAGTWEVVAKNKQEEVGFGLGDEGELIEWYGDISFKYTPAKQKPAPPAVKGPKRATASTFERELVDTTQEVKRRRIYKGPTRELPPQVKRRLEANAKLVGEKNARAKQLDGQALRTAKRMSQVQADYRKHKMAVMRIRGEVEEIPDELFEKELAASRELGRKRFAKDRAERNKVLDDEYVRAHEVVQEDEAAFGGPLARGEATRWKNDRRRAEIARLLADGPNPSTRERLVTELTHRERAKELMDAAEAETDLTRRWVAQNEALAESAEADLAELGVHKLELEYKAEQAQMLHEALRDGLRQQEQFQGYWPRVDADGNYLGSGKGERGKTWFMDDETAHVVDKMVNFTPEEAGKFLKFYDSMLSRWKGYSLLTPGFHIRNYMGGMFNNWLYGVDRKAYARFNKAWVQFRRGLGAGAKKGSVAEGLAKITDDEMRQIMREMIELDVFTFGRAGGSSTRQMFQQSDIVTTEAAEAAYRAPYSRGVLGDSDAVRAVDPTSMDFFAHKLNRRLGNAVERNLRGPMYVHARLAGGDPQDALDTVKRFHFDYSELSEIEAKTMRRLFPFYTWTRKNVPLQLEMMWRRPGRYTAFKHAKENLEMGTEEDWAVPDFYANLMAIRTPWKRSQPDGSEAPIYLTLDLPFRDLAETLDPKQALSSMSPFVKVPAEMVAGRQFFTDFEFREGYGTKAHEAWGPFMPFLSALNGIGGLPKPIRAKDGSWLLTERDAYKFEQFLPPLARMRRLAPTEDKYAERAFTTYLSTIFGVSSRTLTRDAQASEVRRVTNSIDNAVEQWLAVEGLEEPPITTLRKVIEELT